MEIIAGIIAGVSALAAYLGRVFFKKRKRRAEPNDMFDELLNEDDADEIDYTMNYAIIN